MGLKPEGITEAGWRRIIGSLSVEGILYIGGLANGDRVERLVRDARGGNDNDEDESQQQQVVLQRQVAPEAEIRQTHSMDTGDTLTTPSDLRRREKQAFCANLLACLFPWTQNSQHDTILVSATDSAAGQDEHPAFGQEEQAGAFDQPASARLNLTEGLVAVHGTSSRLVGNASVSTVGLPLSEESRRNPQDMSQSDPGDVLFRRGYRSE